MYPLLQRFGILTTTCEKDDFYMKQKKSELKNKAALKCF